MKTRILFITLAFGSMLFTSCRETVTEREVVREREVEVQREEVDNDGIIERTGRKIDTEVNKEIDEEIEKIGDDN